jgi:hypothetical protein
MKKKIKNPLLIVFQQKSLAKLQTKKFTIPFANGSWLKTISKTSKKKNSLHPLLMVLS